MPEKQNSVSYISGKTLLTSLQNFNTIAEGIIIPQAKDTFHQQCTQLSFPFNKQWTQVWVSLNKQWTQVWVSLNKQWTQVWVSLNKQWTQLGMSFH